MLAKMRYTKIVPHVLFFSDARKLDSQYVN